jgi:hypothetical protein
MITVLFAVCAHLNCGHEALPEPVPSDAAAGVLILDVLEIGRPERYSVYQVRPSTASVLMINKEEFSDA